MLCFLVFDLRVKNISGVTVAVRIASKLMLNRNVELAQKLSERQHIDVEAMERVAEVESRDAERAAVVFFLCLVMYYWYN